MPTPALFEYPVVCPVNERAANDRPMVGTPIELPNTMCLWDVFSALQDAVDESGATPSEADALVMATYFELQHCLVSGGRDDSAS